MGNRFSMVPEFDLPPLNRDLPESEAVAWCDKFKNCINEYVFPFFSSISSPQKILDFLKKADDENNTYVFCPKLFKLRAQMFSALFIEKTEQARILIPRYKKEIKRSTFLMPAVLDSLTAEVLGIEKMLLSPSLALTSYFEKNIKDTLFNCFNKTEDGLKS